MAKLTLFNIVSWLNPSASYEANNTLIEAALENTLSRDGTTPNTMSAPLDMNSQYINNLPEPILGSDAARLIDVQAMSATSLPTQTGNDNKFLQTDGTAATWQVPAASEIANTASGNISSTTVQDAINEIDSGISNFSATVLDDTTSNAWLTTLAATRSETGALARPTLNILRDHVTLADFATGSGTETTAVNNAFVAAVGVPLEANAMTVTVGALTSTGKQLQWPFGRYSVATSTPDPLTASNLSAAPALTFTDDSRHGYSHRFGNLVANDIYQPIYPDINNFDVLNGVLDIVSGSTIEHGAAVSGYVKEQSGSTNGVALFGCSMGTATNSAVWGLNTLVMDNATRATHARTGQNLIGYECDLNVMGTATEVIGVSVGGNSLAQPTSANGFVCNVLGTGIEWTTAFNSQDGASVNGLSLGMLQPSGNDLDSQKLLMSWSDAAGTKKTTTLQVDSYGSVGYLIVSSSGSHAFKISTGNLLLDTGQGVSVNGNIVLSDRVTGFTTAAGSANKDASGIDVGTITATDGNIQAVAAWVKSLHDAMAVHGMIGA